jgi:hypothetical protein
MEGGAKTMKNIGKILLPIAGIALTIASSIVNTKNQEAQMEKTIAKKVAEALENKAKES